MCRWLVWVSHEPVNLGEVVLDSENSLLVQSKEAGSLLPAGAFPTKYTLNADGFGVGWYGGSRHRAAAFRSMLPAWNNRNLRELCRAVDSPCFFAHVRATGPAGYVPDDGRYVVNDENCHPFRFENILFQHNGCVRDFFKIRKRVLAEVRDDVFDWVDGKTDSEAIFALILTLLDPALLARADRVPPALLLGATEGAISLILHFLQVSYISAISRHRISRHPGVCLGYISAYFLLAGGRSLGRRARGVLLHAQPRAHRRAHRGRDAVLRPCGRRDPTALALLRDGRRVLLVRRGS